MTLPKENELLISGIKAAEIFSTKEQKTSLIYEKVSSLLYKKFNEYNIADQMRFYVIKEDEKVMSEEIFYNNQGLQPGYDSIPFYQLPDKLINDKQIAITEDDDLCFLLIPFTSQEDLIGMMELRVYDKNILDDKLIEYLNKMSSAISLGLSQIIFKESNMLYKSFFNTALDINKRIQSVNSLKKLISSFMRLTVSRLKFDRVTVFLFDEDEKDIIYSRCFQSRDNEFSLDQIPDLPSPGKKPESLDNASGYWFSLRTHARKVGVVLFDNIYSLYRIPPRLVEILQILCSQFAAAVDNIRLFSNLEHSAHYDELTGLYNRSFLEQKMQVFSEREKLPLSVILGDVNGLKITNDVFGHMEGDKILKNIADILKNICREDDITARWGGDEFIIFLPHTVSENVDRICDRIREECAGNEETLIDLSIALGHATRKNTDQEISDIIKEAEDEMYRQKLMETKNFRRSLILSLRNKMMLNSQETPEHTDRMLRLAVLIGEKIGLNTSDITNLKVLALVHDIGMVAIDEDILNKPCELDEVEWRRVKKHCELGYRIAQASFELSPIAEYILSHHEWWDGTGYPLGKKGKQIPLLSRIIAVVDAYDVMTHERSYSEAISGKDALFEINKCAGSQFDPEIVEVFTKIMRSGEYIENGKEKIIELNDSAEAGLMEYLLEKLEIPFEINSYNDKMYEDIFLKQEKWGYIEADKKYIKEIEEAYDEVREKLE